MSRDIGSDFWCPKWIAKLSVEAASDRVITEALIIASMVVDLPLVCDPWFTAEPASLGVHLVPSCVGEPPSLLLFFDFSSGASPFLRFLPGALPSRLSGARPSSPPLCSLPLLRPANHTWFSASAAVGRSPGCMESMDLSREVAASSIEAGSCFSFASRKSCFWNK